MLEQIVDTWHNALGRSPRPVYIELRTVTAGAQLPGDEPTFTSVFKELNPRPVVSELDARTVLASNGSLTLEDLQVRISVTALTKAGLTLTDLRDPLTSVWIGDPNGSPPGEHYRILRAEPNRRMVYGGKILEYLLFVRGTE